MIPDPVGRARGGSPVSVRPDLASRHPVGAAGGWWNGGSFLGGGTSDPGIMYNNGQPAIFLLGVKIPENLRRSGAPGNAV